MESRLRRISVILYVVLFPVYALATFDSPFGKQPLWFGISLHDAVQSILYGLPGAWLLRVFVPLYWRVCRTPPHVWWQQVLPIGMVLMAVGLVSFALTIEAYMRLGDVLVLGLPLHWLAVSGLGLSCVGLVLFAAGNVGLMSAKRPLWGGNDMAAH